MQQPNNNNQPNPRKRRAAKKPKLNNIIRIDRRKPQAVSWTVELPLNHPCQVYPRVSTPEQKENVSAEMQKDKSFALSCGWREDQIILDDRDLGVSAQLRMEDRIAFNEMLRRIANGTIKAVVVTNVDRLFRNRWGDESGKFMEICFKYGVLVVTPDFVYDFRISWHIDRFKRRCEEAWNYLEYHIYGRVLPAQDERGYAGYWTGGKLPLGYIINVIEKIDGHKNPDHYRYEIYEPHARVIRWIFKRFRQLNGNVNALMAEIEKYPRLFPDFDKTVDPFIVKVGFSHLTRVPGGYTIKSYAGLRQLLTNRVYIGYWVYKGELVRTDYPKAIVDMNDFAYAWNRLSPIELDGTPRKDIIAYRRRLYSKKHSPDNPAILKDCIQAEDPKARIYAKNQKCAKGEICMCYGFFFKETGNKRCNPHITIKSHQLDEIVLDRLRWHLQQPDAEAQFQDFAKLEDQVVNEVSETLSDIERDIEATKALMARIKEEVKSGKLTNPALLEAANDSYGAAERELQRLEKKKGETTLIAREDEDRRTYKQLMQDVENAWEEIVLPEEYPYLVHLFIASVTLAMASPNFFTARIEWRDTSWGMDTALCYKGTYANINWTPEEIAIIERYYPTASRQELNELLPNRSISSMHDYARSRGFRHTRPRREDGEIPTNVCLSDWQVMQKHNITVEDIRKWESVKLVTWSCPHRPSLWPSASSAQQPRAGQFS